MLPVPIQLPGLEFRPPQGESERERSVRAQYERAPRRAVTYGVAADGQRVRSIKHTAAREALREYFGGRLVAIPQFEVYEATREVVCRLLVAGQTDDGGTVILTGIGGARWKEKAWIQGHSPIADAYKAAEADAWKRCAFQLGLFRDIYEREPETVEVAAQPAPREPAPDPGPGSPNEFWRAVEERGWPRKVRFVVDMLGLPDTPQALVERGETTWAKLTEWVRAYGEE